MMAKIKEFFTKKLIKTNEQLSIKLLSKKVDSLNNDVLELSEEVAKIKGLLLKISESKTK